MASLPATLSFSQGADAGATAGLNRLSEGKQTYQQVRLSLSMGTWGSLQTV